MRTGSSANAGETWRSTLSARSRRPPCGSISAPSLVLGHRVDGQVAAREVLLERDAAVGVELEAVVAGAGLALGARERVLLVRLGMEEHREVAADGEVAERAQLVGIGADDDPVAVADRQAEQCVANRAADQIALHLCAAVNASLRASPTNGRRTIPWPRDAAPSARSLESRSSR